MPHANTKAENIQLFKVEELGLQDFVLETFKQNDSPKFISEKIKAEKNLDVHPTAISKWLDRQKKNTATDIQKKSAEKYEVLVMDYQNEIKNILDEVKEMKEKARTDSDLKAYDRMVGRLFQGLELIAKLTGDIKGTQNFDIKVVINEINQGAFKEHKTLRGNLYNNEIIDVEAEIVEEDMNEERRIKRESNETTV